MSLVMVSQLFRFASGAVGPFSWAVTVPKKKTVVSVQMECAALAWATRDVRTEQEWAAWGRTFVQALATNTEGLNPFADSLMAQVHKYRDDKAEQMRNLRGNSHVPEVTEHSEHLEHRPTSTLLFSSLKEGEKGVTRKEGNPWPVFKGMVETLFGKATSVGAEQKAYRLVQDLAALGATPETLKARTLHYLKCWPDAACTLQAVLNNWNVIPTLKAKGEKKKEAPIIDWAPSA